MTTRNPHWESELSKRKKNSFNNMHRDLFSMEECTNQTIQFPWKTTGVSSTHFFCQIEATYFIWTITSVLRIKDMQCMDKSFFCCNVNCSSSSQRFFGKYLYEANDIIQQLFLQFLRQIPLILLIVKVANNISHTIFAQFSRQILLQFWIKAV